MSVGQGKGKQYFSKICITKTTIQTCSRNAGGDYSSGKVKRSTTTARRWLARFDSASARRKCNNKCGSAAASKRKCSRKRHNNNKKKLNLPPAPQITDDILSEEILTKLPLNSLCIGKCVSKLWNSLIMHNFHTSNTPPIICTIDLKTSPIQFCSIDVNTGLVTPNIYNPIDLGGDHFFQPICYNGFIHYFSSREIQHLVVFNPATQEKLLVPNTNRHAVHFGFDPCSNKFKFFGWMNYPHQCEIYTLEKKNSSWRTVTSKPIQGSGKFCSMPFCVNGTIYWYTDTRMIVLFNLATETFGLIQGPNRDIENVDYMFEFEGCLCLAIISYYPQRIMDLWMLKDHGNVDSRWVMIARVNKPPGSEIVWTMPYPTRTGELLLAYSEIQGSQSFYLYSFFTRKFQDIKICGPDLYYILDNFVENLASLQDL